MALSANTQTQVTKLGVALTKNELSSYMLVKCTFNLRKSELPPRATQKWMLRTI